jgi:hypothetical protein
MNDEKRINYLNQEIVYGIISSNIIAVSHVIDKGKYVTLCERKFSNFVEDKDLKNLFVCEVCFKKLRRLRVSEVV